jgi:hypothetical protein
MMDTTLVTTFAADGVLSTMSCFTVQLRTQEAGEVCRLVDRGLGAVHDIDGE